MIPITPSSAAPALTEAVFALTLALLFLAPLAIAGVALINTGLGRSRSAAQSLLATSPFWPLRPSSLRWWARHCPGVSPAAGDLRSCGRHGLGMDPFQPFLLGGLGSAPPQAQLALLFEFLAVALVAMIPGARERTAGG